MAINHLTNREFSTPLSGYYDSLDRSAKAGSLTELARTTALHVQDPGLSPTPPTLPSGTASPRQQFEQAERTITPLLEEIGKQEQIIQSLGGQISSAEQQLAAAQKLENAKRVKLVLTIIGVLFFLFLLSQCMG
jgi:hypothetical protein